jgi:hypothetical protein
MSPSTIDGVIEQGEYRLPTCRADVGINVVVDTKAEVVQDANRRPIIWADDARDQRAARKPGQEIMGKPPRLLRQ